METFGIALQEARALGLPILALRRGNAEEHVEPGKNGFLVDSLDELAERFLALSRDANELAALVARARAAAGAESWDEVVERFLPELGRLSRARV
jgi:glycosyltransferase involved in cell wall biosynthesis